MTRLLAIIIAATALIASHGAGAALVTFDIGGVVLDAPAGGTLFDGKVPFDTWSGSFTVDTAAVATSDNGTTATYDATAVSGFALVVEGVSYAVDGAEVIYAATGGDFLTLSSSAGAVDMILANGTADIFSSGAILNNYDAFAYNFTKVEDTSGVGPVQLGNITAIIETQAAVPEPAALTVFGLGLAGLGMMRRRRRTA